MNILCPLANAVPIYIMDVVKLMNRSLSVCVLIWNVCDGKRSEDVYGFKNSLDGVQQERFYKTNELPP